MKNSAQFPTLVQRTERALCDDTGRIKRHRQRKKNRNETNNARTGDNKKKLPAYMNAYVHAKEQG